MTGNRSARGNPEAAEDAVRREIATYSHEPLDRLVRREWGYFPETLRRWAAEGWSGDYGEFLLDPDPYADDLIGLVGIDVPLVPGFPEETVETTERHILVRTRAGAIERFPRGKRRTEEVMPEYVRNPVESRQDWFDTVKPRLDPDTPARWEGFRGRAERIRNEVASGRKLYQGMAIGGFMYLRAMLGPEGVLLAFYDDPALLRDMMETWLRLLKTCLQRVQKVLPFFKFLIGEDISYKNGPLISPEMMREFLFPWYHDLIGSLRKGQASPMHAEVDTDGNVDALIPLYTEVGFDTFRPFEVAAGCDVVRQGREYPGLVLSGGIDKRVLASGPAAIDAEVRRIIPVMAERGGYIPTCDHTVPSNVTYRDYLFYRRLVAELDAPGRSGVAIGRSTA
jgi:hypothetical protein